MKNIIDSTDAKIILELDRNARAPAKQIAKKVGVSTEVIGYRIKNLLKRRIIKKFVTKIDPVKFGYDVYKFYFKFQNISKEKETELIQWMCDNKNINWIASCKGKWDLNITVFAENINKLDDIMAEFDNRFGTYVLEREFNVTMSVGVFFKDWIVGKATERKSHEWHTQGNVKLDVVDIALLRLLANNARLTLVELAGHLKTTPRIVHHRMKELEKKGVIYGYGVSVDLGLLQKQFFKSILYFDNFPREMRETFMTFCRFTPEVVYTISCMGSWPAEMEIVVNNNQEFYDIMDRLRDAMPKMRGYEAVIISKEHKFDWMPLCYEAEL